MRSVFSFLLLVFFLCGCKFKKAPEPDNISKSNPVEINTGGKLVYPFGFDMKEFQKSNAKSAAGDCEITSWRLEKDSIQVLADSVNCYEYGKTNTWFLGKYGELEAVHQQVLWREYTSRDTAITIVEEVVYRLTRKDTIALARQDTLQASSATDKAFEQVPVNHVGPLLQDWKRRWDEVASRTE